MQPERGNRTLGGPTVKRSEVKVTQSCPALCESDSPWNSPGQNTGGGSLSLLQGIFPTQGSNPGPPHCRQILYQPSYQAAPTKLWQSMFWGGVQFLKALVSLAWILPWKERNWKQESHVVSAPVTRGSLAGALRPQAFTGASLSPPCPSLLHPPLLPLLWFFPCFMVPFRCHLDLGSVFIVPSSGPLKSIYLCVTTDCIPFYILCQLHLFVSLTGLKVP